MARRKKPTTAFSLFAFQDIITATTGIMILLTLLLSLSLVVAETQSPAEETVDVIEELEQALSDVEAEVESLEGELDYLEQAAGRVAGFSQGSLEQELEKKTRQVEHLSKETGRLAQKVGDAEKRNTSWDQRLSQQRQKRSELKQDKNKLREEQRQLERRLAEVQKELKNLRQRLAETQTSSRMVFNPRAEDGRIAWLVEIHQDRILIARAGVKARPVVFTGGSSQLSSRFSAWVASERKKSKDFFVLFIAPDGIKVFVEMEGQMRSSGFSYGTELIGANTTVVHPSTGGA
jgi:uncharacterized phage infection (PIP) family protein YhgE